MTRVRPTRRADREEPAGEAARRRRRPGRGRVATVLRGTAAACALGMLAACASMPSGGGVKDVTHDEASGTEADEQQVRVFGVPPQPGEDPVDLVDGFLEALTSDEPDYQTAKQYLTPQAAKNWKPDAGIKVVDKTPSAYIGPGPTAEDTSAIVDVKSKHVGSVDDQFAYEPQPVPSTEDKVELTVVKNQDGQWRIDDLPDGVTLSRADFERVYRPVNMYWYASSSAEPMLVPDPVYLRSRNALATTLVRKLLQGPNRWIAPVVRSDIPANTRLLDHMVTIDDRRYVDLALSSETPVAPEQCKRMAAQVLYTLGQVSRVDSVRLTVDGQSCEPVSTREAEEFDPAATSPTGATGYFLVPGTNSVSLVQSEGPRSVPGQFGDGSLPLNEIAVDREEQRIAGTGLSDAKLWVGDMVADAKAELWATAEPGHVFEHPTWDGLGGLWVLESVANQGPRTLYWIDRQAKYRVEVEGLDGGNITSIRMSPDGTRISMFVDEGGGKGRVVMGRVNRGVNPASRVEPMVVVDGLRLVVPDLQELKSQSWQGASRLLVLGKTSEASVYPQFVDIDGGNVAQVNNPPSGVVSMAAPNGRDQPLLAGATDERIYRLEPDGWKAVTGTKGREPIYPG
ncbi:LpqB family beta-propeller domain-containing protein [Yinghuangia sp. YIM S09857]|uniref:LpqB family beta-propeller domain-containing protein n=1 Tax=Yinghuangia sp. YIM S09857 TaxID=3436929 RepID=UPI003F532A70